MPGIDLMCPTSASWKKRKSDGLVLTHAHEDHFGAIIDLWPKLQCKIYATRFSAALFEAKLVAERNPPKIPVTVVPSGGRIDLGPFNVEFIPVAHSIPESHALAIHTPAGTVLHTGDWKIDPTPIIGLPTDERRLRELGDAGVLALVGDSTNAVRDGRSPSETEVAATIKKLVKAAKGRVAVTTFASNVARLKAVADAAKAADREVVVVGRAMERVVQVARKPVSSGRAEPRGAGLWPFPPDKVLALCTGSRGGAARGAGPIARRPSAGDEQRAA
jgi:ribonuclease J